MEETMFGKNLIKSIRDDKDKRLINKILVNLSMYLQYKKYREDETVFKIGK